MISVGDLVKPKSDTHPAILNRRSQAGIVIQTDENIYGTWAIVLWSNNEVETVSMNWIKKITLLVATVFFVGCSTVYSACNRHKNKTIMTFCIAERSGDKNYCSDIEDDVFRITCSAKVQKRERVCYDIENVDGREWCLLMLK